MSITVELPCYETTVMLEYFSSVCVRLLSCRDFIIVQWPCDNEMPADLWLILSTEWYSLLSPLSYPLFVSLPLLFPPLHWERRMSVRSVMSHTLFLTNTHTPQSKAGEWMWDCHCWHLQINSAELSVSNWERGKSFILFWKSVEKSLKTYCSFKNANCIHNVCLLF